MATNPLPTHEELLQGNIIRLDTCSICLETFDENHPVVRIDTPACQHDFGKACIKNWLKDKDWCPTCRTVLYTAPPPPPLRLDIMNDAPLASIFVDFLLAKIAYLAKSNRELDVCHLYCFLDEAYYRHGMEHHIPNDNFQYALMGVLFSIFCTIKFDKGRCSHDTQYWVYHVGRALGWPSHVTGDDPTNQNEDEDEDEDDDDDEDEDYVD
ncbi:hypothetical protein N0V91_007227 [Didymella pomorum]|jgi:hypothetical protein|uniref:RING-type domain-containing protein n=1 Tax=Didymella pomorum TaxID=749634 RepID=A0A9W8ZBB0_9PLEO|nr:hypothetical protein N0V91_007227 [Didymella pomorum]